MAISAMTSAMTLRRLVNLNSGLRPNLNRLVLVLKSLWSQRKINPKSKMTHCSCSR